MPINVDCLEELLEGYDEQKKNFIIKGFREGFQLEFEGDRSESYVLPNHRAVRCSPELIQVLENKGLKEVKLGRVVGPFSTSPYPNIQVSLLGLVPKGTDDYRMIFDLSKLFKRN